MTVLTSYHVSATLIVIEIRNNGAGYPAVWSVDDSVTFENVHARMSVFQCWC